ncbi:MAG: hypothetical protein KAG91_01080 [Mycoplasmataceae bacterium]|nr:hypothetical protein [Mycoplasmataceae bacterium]
MTIKEEKLEKVINYTNSELNRSDAKFRNIGTVNSLLIGTLVAIILYALKFEGNTGKIVTISISGFFLGLQTISVTLSLYGIWPRERYTHSPYDIRFTSSRRNIKQLKDGSFSEKRSIQIISINSKMIVRKRRISKMALFFTLFPISIIIVLRIHRQDKTRKDNFSKNDKKYIESLGIKQK